jgi:hypothetical protein
MSLVCCLKVLGSNHLYTAKLFFDLAELFYKIKNKNEALGFYERAYSIYELYIHQEGKLIYKFLFIYFLILIIIRHNVRTLLYSYSKS